VRGVRIVEVFKKIWVEVQRAQVFMAASSLAYTTILSFIPLLAVSFAIFQMFGGLHRAFDLLEPFIVSNLAAGVSAQVTSNIEKFINNVHSTTVGVGGLIALIFTNMTLLSSVERVINRIWNVPIRRSLIQRITGYWIFLTLAPLALSISLGIAGSHSLPVSRFFPNGLGTFFITTAILTWAYKFIPDTKVSMLYSSLSGMLTASCFSVARIAYHLYTSRILSYNHIYGSLSAVPILLLWVYIVWLIILLGAAFCAAIQRSSSKWKQATLESS
jgi:membrane protein